MTDKCTEGAMHRDLPSVALVRGVSIFPVLVAYLLAVPTHLHSQNNGQRISGEFNSNTQHADTRVSVLAEEYQKLVEDYRKAWSAAPTEQEKVKL